MKTTEKIIIKNELSQLEIVMNKINTISKNCEINDKDRYSLLLVMEELLVNIISYGFEEKEESNIEIQIDKLSSWVEIVITDKGKEFNLLAKEEKSTDDFDGKTVGGWGIHLVKKSVDSLEYKRFEDKNIIKIIKSLNY